MHGYVVRSGKTYGYVLYPGPADRGRIRPKRVGGFLTRREAEAELTEALERRRHGTWGHPDPQADGDVLHQRVESLLLSLREMRAASYRARTDGWISPRIGCLAVPDTAFVGAPHGDLVSSRHQDKRARDAVRRLAAIRDDIQELQERLPGLYPGSSGLAIEQPAPGIAWGRAVPIAAAIALAGAVLTTQLAPHVLGTTDTPPEPGTGATDPGLSGPSAAGPQAATPATPLSMPSRSTLGTASGGQGFGIDAAYAGSGKQDAAFYRDGIRLIAGYLPSPGALNAWSSGDFRAAERAGCVTLPLWVPTQDPAVLTAAQGRQDGRQAVKATKAIGHTSGGIGLDMEANISGASPDGTQAYTEAFARTVAHAGFAAVAYGSGQYISQLYAAPGHSGVAVGWVAAWPGSLPAVLNTSQATAAFPGSNMWQTSGNITLHGVGIDPDVVSPGALNAIAGHGR
jgi:Domain of unknown function (DUF1906)